MVNSTFSKRRSRNLKIFELATSINYHTQSSDSSIEYSMERRHSTHLIQNSKLMSSCLCWKYPGHDTIMKTAIVCLLLLSHIAEAKVKKNSGKSLAINSALQQFALFFFLSNWASCHTPAQSLNNNDAKVPSVFNYDFRFNFVVTLIFAFCPALINLQEMHYCVWHVLIANSNYFVTEDESYIAAFQRGYYSV